MDIKFLLYALGIWFILLVLAIVNAAIRNEVYAPKTGEHAGHVISTIIAICYTILVIFLFLKYISIDYTTTDLIIFGVFWLLITIVFEFLFGHYIMGNSWDRLFADYNLLKGRVWSLYLLTILISPYIIGSIFKK